MVNMDMWWAKGPVVYDSVTISSPLNIFIDFEENYFPNGLPPILGF